MLFLQSVQNIASMSDSQSYQRKPDGSRKLPSIMHKRSELLHIWPSTALVVLPTLLPIEIEVDCVAQSVARLTKESRVLSSIPSPVT